VLDTKWPSIVGYDFAGVIVLCGADVKKFKIGDEVYACLPHDRNGSLAEYVFKIEPCFYLFDTYNCFHYTDMLLHLKELLL